MMRTSKALLDLSRTAILALSLFTAACFAQVSNLDREAIVDAVLRHDISESERSEAFGRVFSLPPVEKEAALREIAANGTGSVRVSAATELIRLRAENVRSLILDVVRDDGTYAEGQIFGAMHWAIPSPTEYIDIARSFVISELARPAEATAGGVAQFLPLERASIVLARSDERDDAMLLQRLVIRHGTLWGVWLARAATTNVLALNDEEQVIGQRTMMNVILDLNVRISAAVALANAGHAEALHLVETLLREGVRSFANTDAKQMVEWGLRRTPEDLSKREALKQTARSFRALEHLENAQAAQALLRLGMGSTNPAINESAGFVAAQRSPELALDHTANLRDEARKQLLALVVFLHPELRPRVVDRLDPDTLDRLLERAQQHGVVMLMGSYRAIAG